MLLKQYPKAIGCFDKVLALKPDHAWSWYNKGVSSDKLKYPREAVTCFMKFLEIAGPEHQHRVPTARARVRRARR